MVRVKGFTCRFTNCVSEMPEDLQLSLHAHESGTVAGVPGRAGYAKNEGLYDY
jgi:hypothetical protein